MVGESGQCLVSEKLSIYAYYDGLDGIDISFPVLKVHVFILVLRTRMRRLDQILRSWRLHVCLWLYYSQRHLVPIDSSDSKLLSQF